MCFFSRNHNFRSLASVCPPYLQTSISFKPGFAIKPVKLSEQQEQIRRLNLLSWERAGGWEGGTEGGFVEGGRKVNCGGKGEGKGWQEANAPSSWSKADIVIAAENMWWRFPVASKASWWSDSERFLLMFLRDKLRVFTAAWPASSQKQNRHPSESFFDV